MVDDMTQTLTASAQAHGALTAADRCDRCNAQAYVRVVLAGGADLQFCGHHWARNESALRPMAIEVIDELHRLTAAPATDSR